MYVGTKSGGDSQGGRWDESWNMTQSGAFELEGSNSQVKKKKKHRPIMCVMRPIIYQKRPIIYQKRPIIYVKRPIKYVKRPIMCVKRPFNIYWVSLHTFFLCV